jgi:hypothetical protein
MQNRYAILAAAALAVGGFSFSVNAQDDVNRTDAGRDANTIQRDREAGQAGDRGVMAPNGTAQAPDAEDIRDVLAQLTEASLTKGGFDDLVERFVDADRNRIGNYAEQEMADLDGLVEQFQKDWQAKYNQEFDIKNEELVFNNVNILQGEIGGEARVAGDVNVNRDGGTVEGDVNVDNRTGIDLPGDKAADTNRNDPGRNIATVNVTGVDGGKDLKLDLIHEMPDSWRLDLPDTVDGPKLRQNLMAHLKAAHEARDQWPADVNEGYRFVSYHVFKALLDQPVEADKGQ